MKKGQLWSFASAAFACAILVQACDASTNLACSAGAAECNDGQLRLCDAGGRWGTFEPCPTGACLDAAQCVPECLPGDGECDEGQLRLCDAGGRWGTFEPCPTGACLDAAQCVWECPPGDGECDEGQFRLCDASGLWGDLGPCPTGACLDAAQCTPECAPGAGDCRDGQLRTCDANGLWRSARACPTGACLDAFACASPRLPGPQGFLGLPDGKNRVYLGWRLISGHPEATYEVYRANQAAGPYAKLNVVPIATSTNFVDGGATSGATFYYFVAGVDASGIVGESSPVIAVASDGSDSNVYVSFQGFNPVPRLDNYCDFMFGDVDGDGHHEYLIVCIDTDAAVRKMDVAVFSRDGRRLWLKEKISDEMRSSLPWTLVDLDEDGSEEVVGAIYDKAADEIRVVAYNGVSGAELMRSPPIAHDLLISAHLSPAKLDGLSWSVVVQTGVYDGSARTITALDAGLAVRWEYSLPAGSGHAGAHMMRTADLDGDGTDEVLFGSTILSGEGQLLQQFPFGLVSGFRVGDLRPELPGLEIFYFNKDASDPEAALATSTAVKWEKSESVEVTCSVCGTKWRDGIMRGHHGWIGDVRKTPGMESFVAYYWEPRCPKGHVNDTKWFYRLYAATGAILDTRNLRRPLDWDGQPPLESMPSPGVGGRTYYVADVVGDFREEFIVVLGNSNLDPPHALLVVTNASLIGAKKPSPFDDRNYLIDKRWTGYR